MRRKEFLITDEKILQDFLESSVSGVLSVSAPSGAPYCVPLNFVYEKPHLYFHSALEGRKIEALKHEPRVCFLVHREFSFVPSYYSSKKMACEATHFFISVILEGKAHFCEEPAQKAKALSLLMSKYQPERNHEAISEKSALYRKALEETAVVELKASEVCGKFKFGQNLSRKQLEATIEQLKERGDSIDLETAGWMERLFPLDQP